MFVPGIDSLKNFGANVLALFCKLDRFSSMGKILNNNEAVQLTKMKFTQKYFILISARKL